MSSVMCDLHSSQRFRCIALARSGSQVVTCRVSVLAAQVKFTSLQVQHLVMRNSESSPSKPTVLTPALGAQACLVHAFAARSSALAPCCHRQKTSGGRLRHVLSSTGHALSPLGLGGCAMWPYRKGTGMRLPVVDKSKAPARWHTASLHTEDLQW